MGKYVQLAVEDKEKLCDVAKALSSPIRIDIIKALYHRSMKVNEIAAVLQIPASSAAVHIRILENAGLVHTELQPGERGLMKLCSRKCDMVTMRLQDNKNQNSSNVRVFNMPIGAFTDCEIVPTCGLISTEGHIGDEDMLEPFYLPERIHAQMLWTSAGYIEYRFPNVHMKAKPVYRLRLSMEICSEAPNYREDWKSDITVWINGIDCGTWTSLGDFGERRGRLTPLWVPMGSTQYGLLTEWVVEDDGSLVNGQKISETRIEQLFQKPVPFLTLRIGIKPDARYIGGFNLFGRNCGDYAQDIVLTLES